MLTYNGFHDESSQDLPNSNVLSVWMTFGFSDGSRNFRKLLSVSWGIFVFTQKRLHPVSRQHKLWLFQDSPPFIENLVICCYQVTEIFCPKYCFANALPARSPRNLGSLADFAISVFREVSINTALPGCLRDYQPSAFPSSSFVVSEVLRVASTSVASTRRRVPVPNAPIDIPSPSPHVTSNCFEHCCRQLRWVSHQLLSRPLPAVPHAHTCSLSSVAESVSASSGTLSFFQIHPTRLRPEKFPTCSGTVLFLALLNHRILLRFRQRQGLRVWRRPSVAPSPVSFPLAVSPACRIEFTVKEHPTWYKYSFPLGGIATWFISSRAINSPPEWPWMARTYKRLLFESTHYASPV